MPRNNMDFVLLKSDGIPTYHFAHVVDDHLMRSTHVIRGEEWLSSLPMHVELFNALGWKQPIYCHTATLMKMEGTGKRKLPREKIRSLHFRIISRRESALMQYGSSFSLFLILISRNGELQILKLTTGIFRILFQKCLFQERLLTLISSEISLRTLSAE